MCVCVHACVCMCVCMRVCVHGEAACVMSSVHWLQPAELPFPRLLHTEADESSSNAAKRPRMDAQPPEERYGCLNLSKLSTTPSY